MTAPVADREAIESAATEAAAIAAALEDVAEALAALTAEGVPDDRAD